MGVFETSIAKANHFIWWNRENSTQLSVTAQVQCLYWKVASMFDNLNPQMWNFVLYPSLDILTTEPCQTEKSPKAAEAGCGGWLVLRQWSKNPGGKKPCICIILYNMCIIYIYTVEYWFSIFSTMLEFDMTLRTTRMKKRMMWDIQWYTIKLAEYSRHHMGLS